MENLSLALNLLGALAVFLYGLKVMSEGLQKLAGSRLREVLQKATGNRFKATFSGFLTTCAVQSSSASTVMFVGFASAGLLTLFEALGLVFGANIGTTTTAWIISLLGFKVEITQFALPLIGIGFFSQFIRRWRTPHRVGHVLVGFGLLFLGLHLLKTGIPNLKDNPAVLEMIVRFRPDHLGTLVIVVLVGAIMTIIFQSSSATMAVTLTAAANGLIDYPTAAALVLGENVGTTVTANLAAIGAPLTARRVARGHFFFNIFGVIWAIFLFGAFLRFVDLIAPGDPWGTTEASLLVAIPIHLSLFHTLFNVINTSIFLAFIKPLERFVVWFEAASDDDEDERELIYLSTPLAATPELALPAAQKEVDRMAGVTLKILDKIKNSLNAKRKDLPGLLESIRKDERKTDVLEHRINEFLTQLVHGQLSTPASKEVLSLMSMINDLERIGDHGEKISLLLEKSIDGQYKFAESAKKDLLQMAGCTENNLRSMKKLILERAEDPMPAARDRENELNALRDKFRQSHLKRLQERKGSPIAAIAFTDILTSFEKMGDHSYNVIEATAHIK